MGAHDFASQIINLARMCIPKQSPGTASYMRVYVPQCVRIKLLNLRRVGQWILHPDKKPHDPPTLPTDPSDPAGEHALATRRPEMLPSFLISARVVVNAALPFSPPASGT